MAASTPNHASSASVWGSTAILTGLPKISGRGGNEALEGPGSVEVVLLSPLGSGAALSGKGAALVPVGAAGVVGGASGVLVVLAVMGAAGTAPMISGVPPALGGSVVPGAAAAPAADGASADAWSSSSPVARGGIASVAVDAGSGPSVVWLVFLFFLLFFSSFFSSASLGRRRGKEVRRKVSQGLRIFAGALTRRRAPPILSCREGLRVVVETRRICQPASCHGKLQPRVAGWHVHR
jgi:hypothetical protein